ncbi:MAG: iron ABC transporter [Chloroflexi bacterium]|nr:iron ABC transporter [Chloroflexota bacterium]|tara:strand:+ start:538 stop:1578 length:1041 start_codon:yes stop_codon:yes gene_type:complete
MHNSSFKVKFSFGLAGLVLLSASGILIGSTYIPPESTLSILLNDSDVPRAWEIIIWDIRIPRTLTALSVGAGLGIAGLQMQTLFRNPVADSSILGVTAGASWGVALTVLLGQSSAVGLFAVGTGWDFVSTVTISAITGALIVLVAVLFISQRVHSIGILLIIGLMISYGLASGITLLVAYADPENIQRYLIWGFGSFRTVGWQGLAILMPSLLLSVGIALYTLKQLNALLFGEPYATSVGVNITRLRILTLSSTAICAGVSTAFCGPITFIGIAAPHLARFTVGSSDHLKIAPLTAITGASIGLIAEIIAQLPGHNSVLPLNAVTALLGAPVVIWILITYRKTSHV